MRASILFLACCLAACSSAAPLVPAPAEETVPDDSADTRVTSEITNISVSDGRTEQRFSCTVADTWGYPYLLEGDFKELAIETTDRGVCLPSDGRSVGFCHWAKSFDARSRSLQSCLRRARAELHERGLEMLQERWRDAVSSLSPHWRIDDEHETPSSVTTWVQMLRGELSELPASSFCLPASADRAPRELVISSLQALRWAWQTLDAEQERILGILRRGVQLKAGEKVFNFSVNIIADVAPRPADARCDF